MPPLAELLRALRSNIDPPSMAPEREAAFARRCRERFSRHGAVFAVICVGFSFQILEESLRNVARHARARSVSIDITTTVEALVLRVADDGVGPEDRPGGRGFGVLGMRERARALGGDFWLRGRPEGGTEVTCRLSLAGASGGPS
jgi:signal transduction histidine kinase